MGEREGGREKEGRGRGKKEGSEGGRGLKREAWGYPAFHHYPQTPAVFATVLLRVVQPARVNCPSYRKPTLYSPFKLGELIAECRLGKGGSSSAHYVSA